MPHIANIAMDSNDLLFLWDSYEMSKDFPDREVWLARRSTPRKIAATRVFHPSLPSNHLNRKQRHGVSGYSGLTYRRPTGKE